MVKLHRPSPPVLALLGIGGLSLFALAFTMLPALRGIGFEVQARAADQALLQRLQALQPPPYPFPLPRHLSDAAVPEGKAADLSPLVSAAARRLPGVLKGSALQLTIGEVGGLYEFDLRWDTGQEGTALEIVLRDALGRPRGRWEADSGGTGLLTLPGGAYKVVLSTEGPLGEHFSLTARTGRRVGDAPPEQSALPEIPTLHLNMSASAFKTWEGMRDEVFQKVIVNPSVPVLDQPSLRVPASLSIEDGPESAVRVWLAGVGFPFHFHEAAPSFTGSVTAGPLLPGGVSQFKLYSIRTQGGLLQYVTASIMRDEGLFVPRWLLVRLVFQGRDRGLYLLVETPNSEGFFAGMGRDDGQVWGQGQLQVDRMPSDLPGASRLTLLQEISSRLPELADSESFAKTLAFASRFSIPHGVNAGDLRLYRPAFLESMELVVRDIDTSAISPITRDLLIDTQWWLGPPLRAQGSAFNPKEFPTERPFNFIDESYRKGPTFLAPVNIHPAVANFINLRPENRELFERFLLYSSDESFERRFAHRLQETFRVAQPILEQEDELPRLPGQAYSNLSELQWVNFLNQTVLSQGFKVPKSLPTLFRQSLLLSFEELPEDGAGPRRATLYNLSPFSARLRLPPWARPVGAASPEADPRGLYLAPSPLFPAVLPILGADPEEQPLPQPLPREAARRLLALERLRLQAHPDDPYPLVDLEIPQERWQEFQALIAGASVATLATSYPLPPGRVFRVEELSAITTPPSYAPIRWDFDRVAIPVDLMAGGAPQLVAGRKGAGAGFAGPSNLTDAQLDISSWPALTLSFWLKPEPTYHQTTILDFKGPLPPKGSEALSWPIPAGADYRYYRLFIDDPKFLSMAEIILTGEAGVLVPQSLSASDVNDPAQGAQALVDENPGTFWHIETTPRTSRHWVALDFGQPVRPTRVSALPRGGFAEQLWRGENAVLQGSPDGQAWQDLARLPIDASYFVGTTRLALQLSPSAEDPAQGVLSWSMGGIGFSSPIPFGEWSHLTLTADRETRWLRFFLNGDLRFSGLASNEPFGPGARPSWGGAQEGFFAVDEVMLSPRPLTDDDASWLMDVSDPPGPAPPQVVALPLGISPTAGGHRLTLLLSNFSRQEVSLNLAALKWRLAGGEEIPYRLTGAWALGERPQPLESPRVTLGPARYDTQWFELGRSSPLLWTGALWALLVGPAEGSSPNAVLVEVELRETAFSVDFRTDADDLARSAIASDGAPVRIALHESPLSRLPNNLPAGAFLQPQTISASDANAPDQGAQALRDEDPATFWLIKDPPISSRHWVALDFGRPVRPTGVLALPRRGAAWQMWSGENAVLQGSPDGQAWQDIAPLPVDKESLLSTGSQMLSFPLPPGPAYRYYRLFIDDPGFLSMAEMRLLGSVPGAGETVSLQALARDGIVEIMPSPPDAPGEVRFKDKQALVTGLVEIPPGSRLALEPGTVLRFSEGAGILSYGPISALGTREDPVQLLPAEGASSWRGVAIVNAPERSELRWVQMTGATGGAMGPHRISGGLAVMGSPVRLEDTVLQGFTSPDTLHLHRSAFEIERLTILGGSGDGIDSDWSYGRISDSHLKGAEGDALDLSGSLLTIERVLIEAAQDKGISVGEGSVAHISDARIVSNRIGVAVKDASLVFLEGSELSANEYGLLRYVKKPAYTYPFLSVANTAIRGNIVDRREEAPSRWTSLYDQP